jgi:hypothetical protein
MKKIRIGNRTLYLVVVLASIAAAVALAGTPADTLPDPAPAATEGATATAVPASCVATADTAPAEPVVFPPTEASAGFCYGSNMQCLLNCSCPFLCKRFCDPYHCCNCIC